VETALARLKRTRLNKLTGVAMPLKGAQIWSAYCKATKSLPCAKKMSAAAIEKIDTNKSAACYSRLAA